MLNLRTTFKPATLLLVVAEIAMMTASPALAGEQDFKLVNKTGVEIHKLYVAPHSSQDWGEDILGKDTLSSGESVDITFHRSETATHWDLSIVDGQGNSVVWESLNLKEIEEVTLFLRDGKAIAEFK